MFLKFKGGKGVATGLGVVFGIAPYNFVLCFALGMGIIALTGYVSLASMTGAVFLSILMFSTRQPAPYAWGILLLAAYVIYKHVPNIKRLINGTEMGYRGKTDNAPACETPHRGVSTKVL